MKRIIGFIGVVGAILVIWIWVQDVFFTTTGDKEPQSKKIKAFLKVPDDYDVPKPLNSSTDIYDKVKLYIILDISGSVSSTSIINFYKNAAASLKNYNPEMYYFSADIRKIPTKEWTSLTTQIIDNWRKEKTDLGYQKAQTNILRAVELIPTIINQKDKDHLVLIVSDDIYDVLEHYPTYGSKGEEVKRTQVEQELTKILSEYNVSLNLIKLNPSNENNFKSNFLQGIVYSTKSGKFYKKHNYIENGFPEFSITKAENLDALSKKFDREIAKRLLLADFNLYKPSGFIKPDTNICDNEILGKDFIFDVEKRTTYNQNVFVEFTGYPDENYLPLKLKKEDGTVWFGFRIYNNHNFFPVSLRIKDIIPCGVPGLNFKVPKGYSFNGYDNTQLIYFVEPKSSLTIKLPVEIKYRDYKKKKFTNLKINYDVEYHGYNKEDMQYIVQKYPTKLRFENGVLKGAFTEYSNVDITGNLVNSKLISVTNVWKWWYVFLLPLCFTIVKILVLFILPPNINNWKIQIDNQRVSKKQLKRIGKRSYYVSNTNIKGALDKHIILIPYKTRFGFNFFKSYRDDLKVKFNGFTRIVDSKDNIKENVISSAKVIKGTTTRMLILKIADTKLIIY